MSISEEEAQKERDDINAEIAKEKGLDPETGEPIDKDKKEEEHREPADGDKGEDPDDKDKGKKDDKDPDADDDADDEDDSDDDSENTRKPKQRIPLSKLQEFKRKSREEKEALISEMSTKDAKIKELEDKLQNSTSDADQERKIEAYAEAQGMTVEAVKGLLELVPKSKVDPEIAKSAKLIETEAKKLQAENDFKSELDALIEEIPEAAEVRDAIRKEAFKKENLSKSLYEIYNRHVKTAEVTPKRKTGESSRGANRASADATTDIDKIVENVINQKPGALEGLSDKVIDEVFEKLDKKGSRYQK